MLVIPSLTVYTFPVTFNQFTDVPQYSNKIYNNISIKKQTIPLICQLSDTLFIN